MDHGALLTHLAERLYRDIRFVTEQNPVQIVDDDGARAFNNLLNRVRTSFGEVDYIQDFQNWSPRTIKYKDALVVVGQLHALLQQLSGSVSVQAPVPKQQVYEADNQNDLSNDSVDLPPASEQKVSQNISQNDYYGDQMQKEPPSGRKRESQFDQELYGNSSIPDRNEDGTIPFRLD